MAARKQQLKIACIGLNQANQIPIKSAVDMTSSRLRVQFDWTAPAIADICIVNIAKVDPGTVAAVVIRYTERQNGQAVDLVRPVRVGQLLNALQKAMLELDQRLASAAARPKPRRYRGQIIDEAPEVDRPPPASDKPATGKTVVYRGVRVQR